MTHQHHNCCNLPDTHSPLITLSNVSLSYGTKTILSDVNLTIDRGDFLAITGPNGGGKTTLMRLILRLIQPTTGTVTYHPTPSGEPLKVGYLPQKNMIDSHFPITVSEVIGMGLVSQSVAVRRTERTQLVRQMTELVGLTEHADASVGKLSGGQLQRALLGRALIASPRLLVLDEPLSYVDRRFEERIYSIISEIAPSTTILLVSHDMSRIASMASRHIIVDHRLEFCHSNSHFMHYDCCSDPDRPGTSHALASHKR